jgi:hypothetical protein
VLKIQRFLTLKPVVGTQATNTSAAPAAKYIRTNENSYLAVKDISDYKAKPRFYY